MKRTPCEETIWTLLPVIRKELARTMVLNFNLNQKETAEKLGLTPAAVCQYLNMKRGQINITNQNIIKEIDKSAKIIINNSGNRVIPETCRICKLIKENGNRID